MCVLIHNESRSVKVFCVGVCMRRSQARLAELPAVSKRLVLAELRCRRCGALGVAHVALGTDARGAIERAWCSTACARLDRDDPLAWMVARAERPRGRRRSESAGGARSPPAVGPNDT